MAKWFLIYLYDTQFKLELVTIPHINFSPASPLNFFVNSLLLEAYLGDTIYAIKHKAKHK